MNRREFLGTLAAAPLAVGAQTLTAKRTFDPTTRIELPGARGRTVAWIPLPLSRTTVVSTGKPLPFLMYPQAEVDGVRRDGLDPAAFTYTITARQV